MDGNPTSEWRIVARGGQVMVFNHADLIIQSDASKLNIEGVYLINSQK